MRAKLVVLHLRKRLQVHEKNLFQKKFLSAYSSRYDLQNSVWNFFKRNGYRDIQVSVILRFRKIVLHNKIINKTRLTNNQENPAYGFGDYYLKNRLVKSLQDKIKPWRIAALNAYTGYHFFRKHR